MLYLTPPHTVDILQPSTSRDASGGAIITYSEVATSIPCSIAVATSNEVERFAAQQIRVTHTVAILTSSLAGGGTIFPGYLLVTADGMRLRIHSIRSGKEYGNIPAFTYVECEQLL